MTLEETRADSVPSTAIAKSTGSTWNPVREFNTERSRACAMATFDRCVVELGIRQEVP